MRKLLIFAAFAVSCFSTVETFAAEASILVRQHTPVIVSDPVQPATTIDDFKLYKKTQEDLIRSDFVVGRALKNDKVRSLPTMQDHKVAPVAWVKENLLIDSPDDTEIIKISLNNCPPNDAAEIVNAVVTAYMTEIVDSERQDLLRRRNQLELNYGKTSKLLGDRQEEYYKVQRQQGIFGESARRLANRQLDYLVERREKLQDRVFEMDLRVKSLQNRKEQDENTSNKTTALQADKNEITALQADKKACNDQIDELNTSIGEKTQKLDMTNVDLERMGQEITGLKEHAKMLDQQLKLINLNLDAEDRVKVVEKALP